MSVKLTVRLLIIILRNRTLRYLLQHDRNNTSKVISTYVVVFAVSEVLNKDIISGGDKVIGWLTLPSGSQ